MLAVRFRLQVAPSEVAKILETADDQSVPDTPWWAAITASDGTVVVDVEIGPREDEKILAENRPLHHRRRATLAGAVSLRRLTHGPYRATWPVSEGHSWRAIEKCVCGSP